MLLKSSACNKPGRPDVFWSRYCIGSGEMCVWFDYCVAYTKAALFQSTDRNESLLRITLSPVNGDSITFLCFFSNCLVGIVEYDSTW